MRRIRRFVLLVLLLAVAGYVIWGWVESVRLSRRIAAIQQRGEPIDLDFRRQPPDTREQQTAARLYAEAAALAQERGREEQYRFVSLDVDQAATPVLDPAELAATYREDAPPLQLLDQATALDFSRFGPVAPELAESQSPLVSLNALNALRADVRSRRDDPAGAAAALVASIRLHRTLATTVNRYQADGRLLGSLRIFLRHTVADDATLAALQRAFAEWPDEDTLAGETLARRAEYLASLRRRRGPGEAVLGAVFRPAVCYYARRQLDDFEDALAFAREGWREKLVDMPGLIRRFASQSQMGSRGPAWWNHLVEGPPVAVPVAFYVDAAALDLATRRVAIAALAAERFRRAHQGAAPPALDALVPTYLTAVPADPFSGKPLIYKRGPDSYAIYSIDTNRIDDGGALYGHGALATGGPRGARPARDFGVRVPVTVIR